MDCTPTWLLAQSRCFSCLPRRLNAAIRLSLICQWQQGPSGPVVPTCDPDALTFLTAAGIAVESTEGQAVCKLVADLKANGSPTYWSRDEVIYPFVGGTAARHLLNLKNPLAYPITWVGAGLTHSAIGVKGDGSASYGRTGYTPVAAQRTALRVFHYLQDYGTTAGRSLWGYVGNNPAALNLRCGPAGTSTNTYLNDYSSWVPFFNLTPIGANCTQRNGPDAGDEEAAYQGNGFVTGGSAVGAAGMTMLEIYLFSHLQGGSPSLYSNATLSGWSIGAPFASDADWLGYRAIWETFQTSLGRQKP